MAQNQAFPESVGRLAASGGHRDEMVYAHRDMADFVVKDSLENAPAARVPARLDPGEHRRRDVKPACLQHHRHHRQPRRDVMASGLRRVPQAGMRGQHESWLKYMVDWQ